MSERHLDPTSLLFQSFRHSQGSVGPQLYIFRYIDLQFGIQPELHPNGPELLPYEHYIAGAKRTESASHLILTPNQEDSYKGQVVDAIKDIRRIRHETIADREYEVLGKLGLAAVSL